MNGWHGVFGLQFNHSDYNAMGEEAFTPANTTSSYALYLIEQKKVGNVTFELGGRLERTTLDADASEVELDVLHDEHEGEESCLRKCGKASHSDVLLNLLARQHDAELDHQHHRPEID